VARHDATLFDFARWWLEHDTYSVKDLAAHLGVSLKHVYDLKKKLVDSWGIDLALAKENPTVPRGNIGISEAGRDKLRAVLELVDSLPFATGEPDYQALAAALYVPLNNEYEEEDLVAKVLFAINRRRVAHMTYRNSKGDTNRYHINVFRLFIHRNYLYLCGIDHDTLYQANKPNDYQFRRLDRVLAFTPTEQTFAALSEADINTIIDKRFGAFRYQDTLPDYQVRVRFSPEVAHVVRSTKRHITDNAGKDDAAPLEPDGSFIWQAEVPLVNRLVQWLVSYGADAEVLEPAELRTMVREFAEGTVRANAPK
jgi:predicted DNA-binding transcriptional regulator YafY